MGAHLHLKMRAWAERLGYAAVLLANVFTLVVLKRADALNEASVVALHVANIVCLAGLEFVTPMNPSWLLVRDGRVRWRLLSRTYLWYLFDSRVWFRLHGVMLTSFAVWLAGRLELTSASGLHPLLQLAALAVVVDVARYWIHRGQHALPFLWRWHTMHHAPTNLTPVRAWWTHPVDDTILYSLEIVLMVVFNLDPVVVLAYVSLDNSFQLLNHANCRLRSGLLGAVLQHPRYHLLHHRRVGVGERTVNFGEMFTLWDRMFGTFEAQPHDAMSDLEIGIEPRRRRTLVHQLTAPFWRPSAEL